MKSLLRRAPALFGLVLLVGAVFVVTRMFGHLKLGDITHAMHAIPERSLIAGGLCTCAAYLVLTFYDRLATRYAGCRLPWHRTAFASFCAYVLSHNLGFSALSGAAVRYRLYAAWGLAPGEIARIIAFCSLTFFLGSMAIGGGVALFEPAAVPFLGSHVPRVMIMLVGAGFWSVVAAYMTLSRRFPVVRLGGHEIVLPGARTGFKQVALAVADVTVTSSIAFSLMPHADGLSFARFLTIYIASYSAGLVASLPGGLGVFDAAMMLGLRSYLPPAEILGSILVFRLYYYVIPLFLAGAMFAVHELYLRGVTLAGFKRAGRSGVVRASEADFSVAASTGLTALSGALLLAIGVLEPGDAPGFLQRSFDVGMFASHASEYVVSLIGAALMVLAVGLSHRVTLAWGASVILLTIAAAICLAQGQPIWIAGSEIVAALLMLPFRDAYYRHARILSEPLEAGTALPLVAIAACVLSLARLEPTFRYLDRSSWWQVVLSRELPGQLRLSVLLLVVVLLAATWRLIRPGRVSWLAWRADGCARFNAMGGVETTPPDGVVLGETGRSCIAFRRVGDMLLGLGDPAGGTRDRISAVWRFRDLAVQEGRTTAVWRAGSEMLDVWADIGLTAWPIGKSGEFLCCPDESGFRRVVAEMEGRGSRT
jgi:uncharacterized membrane protein YbhN (UPF0104 family)